MPIPIPILHLTRGPAAVELGKARALHNEFVGSGPQPGIEIARSLGDISHAILVSAEDTAPQELLFVDLWVDGNGMEAFFGNPFAQETGDLLFSSREESEWHRAPGGFDYQVPTPDGLEAVYFAVFRARTAAVADAVPGFVDAVSAQLPSARRQGQLSHALYVRERQAISGHPASNSRRAEGRPVDHTAPTAEILALDAWPTLDGIYRHYRQFTQVEGIDAGELTVWRHADGFIEW
ncbi:hypothetical protein [Nocardia sp. NPDC004604]|uniref:hypothetical protein n=1 Tax=Nocardia sp. NPDC004604 TaxID=3157013 RepID=UPI0033B93059